ncbi:MAG: organic solvent tolerance protein OstA [Cyanothece sp. SIO1E1]|nr:organic solvent tolerance protein OstA [Cyanothece sp. SIO1E1]
MRYFRLALTLSVTLMAAIAMPTLSTGAKAQSDSQALTLRSDVQEANALTGVVTARGNVQINYPSRQIQATSAQAQYYSKERRIVLSGDVYVLQEGNSLRAETITYLIDEGRFVALPEATKQVESIYIVPESEGPAGNNSAAAPNPALSVDNLP